MHEPCRHPAGGKIRRPVDHALQETRNVRGLQIREVLLDRIVDERLDVFRLAEKRLTLEASEADV